MAGEGAGGRRRSCRGGGGAAGRRRSCRGAEERCRGAKELVGDGGAVVGRRSRWSRIRVTSWKTTTRDWNLGKGRDVNSLERREYIAFRAFPKNATKAI
jgi:hypothetical protein